MSSRLVKAFNVVAKTEQKVVGVPTKEQILMEDMPPQPFVDLQKEELQLELARQKERAHQELNEWRTKEEERFRSQLEEEKRLGYEEGYQLGIEDGNQHAKEQNQIFLQKAADILEQAYQEKAAIIQEADPFVIELTMEIAKKVIQQELKTQPDALLHIIKQTLSSVYETDSISIGVAPEDFSFVQKQREQLLAIDNGQVEIKVFPDYSIQQGGCIIRTSSGSVDARIDVQLSEIKKVLLAHQQEDSRG
ncbi:FliH/SctL family protein [Bacillus sp. OK048]|uniref:FliH/SctL family protein n=1 Tax=Bacillus sp. OK048 TaxID=1882761 RepID=UPI0008871DF5|nr:FliH/SctL family protein [Bacillus sp. OK048]SDM91327.1 flagellar assembly protein FliH [Bacillus sp. OK048]